MLKERHFTLSAVASCAGDLLAIWAKIFWLQVVFSVLVVGALIARAFLDWCEES